MYAMMQDTGRWFDSYAVAILRRRYSREAKSTGVNARPASTSWNADSPTRSNKLILAPQTLN